MSMLGEKSSVHPKLVKAYGPKIRVGITTPTSEDRTKQSFKDECDINTIMSRYQKTGVINFQQKFQPSYGDVSAHDFQNAMLTVARGKTMFAELPATIRDRFRNDPANFLDFVQNTANEEEARALGLLKPKETDTLSDAALTKGDHNGTDETPQGTESTRRAGATRPSTGKTKRNPSERDPQET